MQTPGNIASADGSAQTDVTAPAGRRRHGLAGSGPVVGAERAATVPATVDLGGTITYDPAHVMAPDPGLEQLAQQLRTRTRTRYERFVKPLIDRTAAALLIVLLLPVLLAISIAVLLAMGRPIFFGQVRAGQHGRPFKMLKFRTMRLDRRVRNLPVPPELDRRRTHKSSDDPRHTRLGRWLRKTSLDELPQLLHVLRGEMSLVGPRPELMALVTHYAPWQQTRHVVRPGVTGLWQVTDRGAGRMLHECTELDLEYIANISLRYDLSILLRTPLALLRNDAVV